MRVATTCLALLLLAAASTTASAAMYIPSGAYCSADGMKVLVSGTNFLIRSQTSSSFSQMRLYTHQVTQMGNVTLSLTDRTYYEYGRLNSVMWDAYSKSLSVNALVYTTSISSTYSTTNLTAALCPAATTNYLPSGVMCSASATVVASEDLMLLSSSSTACGGTYSLSSTSSPFSNLVGTCPASITYMAYDSTAKVLYGRATVSGYRYSVAMTAGNCAASWTMLPNTTSWCPATSTSSSSTWANSVLAFDNVNNLFAWVPKYGGQECIRLGTYSTQGSSVDLLTVTDQCYSGVAAPAGLIYDATAKSLVFQDNTGTSVTFNPCTTTADATIPDGWTCGGNMAGMVIVGTTFIVRPDMNSNSGAASNPMSQCVVAGTFVSPTAGATWTTASSSTSTCTNSISTSSIRIGVSNATTTTKSVWFNMIRGNNLEGYTFGSDLCSVAPTAMTGKTYNVSVPNGPWGPLVVDDWSYATFVFNSSWGTTSWCDITFVGAQLTIRGGRVAFVVNATNGGSCSNAVVMFDLQMTTAGVFSFNVGTSYSSSMWTTAMTPTTSTMDGVYCGLPTTSLTISGMTYIWREPSAIIVGSLWGSGADWWADVQGYTSGSGSIKVLHVGSASGVLTVSLNNGGTKTMSSAQCAASSTWTSPATASYCAADALGMSLSFSTAWGGFSLALIDPTKANQCVISGNIVVGPSGVTTAGTLISPYCPSNLGVYSLSFATGLSIVVSNGTNTATVSATSGGCATTPLTNGLYCQPNTTWLNPASATQTGVYVMIAGSEFTLSTSGWILSTNYTLNSTGAIVLDTFQPVALTKIFWATAVGGATTTGIWYTTNSQNIFLTQANCAAATPTAPSTVNTVMTTAAAVADLGNVMPILTFDYTTFTLYFPNATSTTYDCTIMGSYVVSDKIASYGFSISASCPALTNLTSMTFTTTTTVTVGLVVSGKAVSIDFASANCKATGVATGGRSCTYMQTSAVYVCNDRYFIYAISGNAVANSNVINYVSTLSTFGNLTAASATNTTAWSSSRIAGVSSSGPMLSITTGKGDLLWSSTSRNEQLSVVAPSYCNSALVTPTEVAATWPGNWGNWQFIPVGPYCGKRTGDASALATTYPQVLTQTFVSLPNNTIYLNITAPGQLQACTILGTVSSVHSGTGELELGFSPTTGMGCTAYDVQAYTQFTSAYFSASTNTLTFTGFTYGNGAPESFTYTLAGGSCAARVAVAATPGTTVQTIQQGTFNGTTPSVVTTLVTLGDVYAIHTYGIGAAGSVLWSGGTYKNMSTIAMSSNGNTPLVFTKQTYNDGVSIYNASALPSTSWAPAIDFTLGSGEQVTVLGYTGTSASVSGSAANDDSGSDDDNKKKVIIAVIAVVVVAAVVGLALMLKRGGGGGSRGSGQREGDNYQQMSGSKV